MEFDDAEAIFFMKPAAVIEGLTRQFVAQQVAIAQARDMAAGLPDDDPKTAQYRAQAASVREKWINQQLPNLAASMRLALEVLDTYGPEGVRVSDATDAAIWNNKFFVWRDEFGGE